MLNKDLDFQVDCSEFGYIPIGNRKQIGFRTCEYCGISADAGMTRENNSAESFDICPLCYASKHLDYAGLKKTGIIIWLPEISQAKLNLLVTTIFATVILGTKGGVPEDHIVNIKTLYKTFENRAQPISGFFSNMGQLYDSTSPLFLAQQIIQARNVLTKVKTKNPKNGQLEVQMNVDDFNQRLDGLRFLGNAKEFMRFFKSVSRQIEGNFSNNKQIDSSTESDDFQPTPGSM